MFVCHSHLVACNDVTENKINTINNGEQIHVGLYVVGLGVWVRGGFKGLSRVTWGNTF